MSIFAVLTDEANEPLERAIEATFPDNFYKIRSGQFLIAASSTAADVSNKLGIADGTNGGAVVLSIANYFGRAEPAIWEWIKTKWGNGA
jgi:hypothetical protein